jgi:hypothetical protein
MSTPGGLAGSRIDVAAAPEALVHALRLLLDGFADNVRHQLDEALQRSGVEVESGPSIAVRRAFRSWAERVSTSVMVGADDEALRAELSRQTAYVNIVRLLLVRICEDRGLFQRRLSGGSVARYLDYAAGRSYEYLTPMACEHAEDVCVRFYGAPQVFDWYRMDEETLLRSRTALDAFDLRHLDSDVIGTVYGQHLGEGKHGQGRYYTPRPLVRAMLDTLGYRGGPPLGRRLGDLACGSGSFLVEACRRLLERARGAEERVPKDRIEATLEEVRRSLVGCDNNPFACYLAETNLLIQVLDLVARAREEGLSLTVGRFAIHCTDSLTAPEISGERADFAGGFDFLIGNPPYVRADEKGGRHADYRRRVEGQGWFSTRHLKWDLYVPFVERYQRLLSEAPGARACLVTIASLATAPYAEKLRRLLSRQCTLHEVIFLEKLGLFTDASWQDNIVFCFSRGAPPEGHEVERRVAREQDGGGLVLASLDVVAQSPRLFNKRAEVALDLTGTVRFDEICYVTVGMVLNSDEKIAAGSIVDVPRSYDPRAFGEQLVEDRGERGKRIRHKAFTRDELVASAKSEIHTRPTVGSREILRGGIGRVRWLEYGEHTRCPERVRRPTFPQLYDRTKIMFGAFTGVAVDEGTAGAFLVVPHTVRVAVRWCDLEGVETATLDEARRALGEEKRYRPEQSRALSAWYLCALSLSKPIQDWLRANKRSMKDDVYPGDIKAIPVKRISPAAQRPYVDLARERHRLWSELTALEAEGPPKGRRVALGARRDEQKAAVKRREKQIEAIGAEIDRLAWALYRAEEQTEGWP